MANHSVVVGKTQGKRIAFRLSDDEHARLCEEAALHGMTFSQLGRNRLVGTHVRSKIDAQAISELRRQGSLLKHLASIMSESDAFDPAQFRETLKAINACILRIHADGTK